MHSWVTRRPTIHRILFNKSYNPCIPVMQDSMPRSWPICGSWCAHRAWKQFSECHVNILEPLFKVARWRAAKQATGDNVVTAIVGIVIYPWYTGQMPSFARTHCSTCFQNWACTHQQGLPAGPFRRLQSCAKMQIGTTLLDIFGEQTVVDS